MAPPSKLNADIERGRRIALREASRWGYKKGSGRCDQAESAREAPARDPIIFVPQSPQQAVNASSGASTCRNGQEVASAEPYHPNVAALPALAQLPLAMPSQSSAAVSAPASPAASPVTAPPLLSVQDSLVAPAHEQQKHVDAPSDGVWPMLPETVGSARILETEGCPTQNDNIVATTSPQFVHQMGLCEARDSALPTEHRALSTQVLGPGVGSLLDGDSANELQVEDVGVQEVVGCAASADEPSETGNGQNGTMTDDALQEMGLHDPGPEALVGAEADGCAGGVEQRALASDVVMELEEHTAGVQDAVGTESSNLCDTGITTVETGGAGMKPIEQTADVSGMGAGGREADAHGDGVRATGRLGEGGNATAGLQHGNAAGDIGGRVGEAGEVPEEAVAPMMAIQGSPKGDVPHEQILPTQCAVCVDVEGQALATGFAAAEAGSESRHPDQVKPYQLQPALAAVDKDVWKVEMARGIANFRSTAAKRSRRGSPIASAPLGSPIAPVPLAPVDACARGHGLGETDKHATVNPLQDGDVAIQRQESARADNMFVGQAVPGASQVARQRRVPDVVVLVDGDNSANILKFVQQFMRESQASVHVFVSRWVSV